MIRRFYADIAITRDVICVLHMDDPDEGPPAPPIYEGVECQYLGTEFVWDAPSDTCKPTCPVGATAIIWVETAPLGTLKARKVNVLRKACTQQIVGGFVSTALGSEHIYPSEVLDQHNLNGLVTRSLYGDAEWSEVFWCRDAAGIWARRPHTAAQIQQVGSDAIAAITAAQAKCDSLCTQANAAQSPSELEEVKW